MLIRLGPSAPRGLWTWVHHAPRPGVAPTRMYCGANPNQDQPWLWPAEFESDLIPLTCAGCRLALADGLHPAAYRPADTRPPKKGARHG